jgi:hypothetical protein
MPETLTVKDLMQAYALPSTHHHLNQWVAGLRLVDFILNYMRPDGWQPKPMPSQQVFDALVAGRCWDEAVRIAWEHIGADLGCSSSTEHLLAVGAKIIQTLADEDQAKVDRANTE